VFINAVGGVKISEPAVDLAVLLSIVSSLKNKELESKLIVFGEVGLAGEVRPVQGGQVRLKEAEKLGFTKAIIPKANAPKGKVGAMQIIAVERLDQALNKLRNS
jgi:DNA repair protein RadA/Sms